jgi:hypothetical protein
MPQRKVKVKSKPRKVRSKPRKVASKVKKVKSKVKKVASKVKSKVKKVASKVKKVKSKVKRIVYRKLGDKKKSCVRSKVAVVMREFKNKRLKSSAGYKVTNPKQGIAIALAVARKACL